MSTGILAKLFNVLQTYSQNLMCLLRKFWKCYGLNGIDNSFFNFNIIRFQIYYRILYKSMEYNILRPQLDGVGFSIRPLVSITPFFHYYNVNTYVRNKKFLFVYKTIKSTTATISALFYHIINKTLFLH